MIQICKGKRETFRPNIDEHNRPIGPCRFPYRSLLRSCCISWDTVVGEHTNRTSHRAVGVLRVLGDRDPHAAGVAVSSVRDMGSKSSRRPRRQATVEDSSSDEVDHSPPLRTMRRWLLGAIAFAVLVFFESIRKHHALEVL